MQKTHTHTGGGERSQHFYSLFGEVGSPLTAKSVQVLFQLKLDVFLLHAQSITACHWEREWISSPTDLPRSLLQNTPQTPAAALPTTSSKVGNISSKPCSTRAHHRSNFFPESGDLTVRQKDMVLFVLHRELFSNLRRQRDRPTLQPSSCPPGVKLISVIKIGFSR